MEQLFLPIITKSTVFETIDLSKLTPEEITRLEREIQQYKEQNTIVSYEFTMRVTFKPINHKNDMLTSGGETDSGLFEDYLHEEIIPKIKKDFGIDVYPNEKVNVISCYETAPL